MDEADMIPAPRKLSHHEAKMEQYLYWSRKTIPERLAAATALTKRMQQIRGINIDEQDPDLTPRFVPRRRGSRLKHLVDAEMLALISDPTDPH